MDVRGPFDSLEHPRMRQGLPLRLSRVHVGPASLDIFLFFFSPCLFAFVYSFVHIFSSLLLRRACVRVPLERPLQILEDLSIVWKHTFIFEESFGPTKRHVLANYVEDLVPGVKKITISRWYENLTLIFDESTLE